jgi:hypothetical protein
MKWKRYGRKRSWPDLRYYPDFCLYELRKSTKNLSQDSCCPCRYVNPGPQECWPLGRVEARCLSWNGRRRECTFHSLGAFFFPSNFPDYLSSGNHLSVLLNCQCFYLYESLGHGKTFMWTFIMAMRRMRNEHPCRRRDSNRPQHLLGLRPCAHETSQPQGSAKCIYFDM